MVKEIIFTNFLGRQTSITLRGGDTSGYIITDIGGLGPVASEVSTTALSAYDGEVFINAKLTSRNITVTLKLLNRLGEVITSMDVVRRKAYYDFPVKKKLRIDVIMDNGASYYIYGYVESLETDYFSKSCCSNLSIICPDPFWREQTEIETTHTTQDQGVTFPIYFGNGLSLSGLTNYFEIEYSGEYEAGVHYELTVSESANVSKDIVLSNVTTGQDMVLNKDMLAYTDAATDYWMNGDIVTITTEIGNKTVKLLRNNVEYDILTCVEVLSKWPVVQSGTNIFKTYFSDGSSETKFNGTIKETHNNLHGGV